MDINDLGKKAILPDKPAGDDPQGLPEFEQLEAELAKATSLVDTGGIDWQKVRRLAETVLDSKSKHLMTASYLSVALLRQEKLAGMAQGVHILLELLENFWIILYPPIKRMRGRKNAIDWWLEKTDAALAGLAPEKWPAEARDKFLGELDALDSFISQNLPDAPYLRPLIEKVGALILVEEASPAGEAPPPAAPVAGDVPAPAPPPVAPQPSPLPAAAPVLDGTEPDKLLRQGLDLLCRAAGAYRQKDPCHPLAFRLNRLAAWLPIQAAPPATDGRTRLPVPDKPLLASLRNLRQAGNWSELLAAAESRVTQHLFWLDLSCWAAEALTRLGHPDTAREIGEDTAAFVQRVPGVEGLLFADGTPFAEAGTRAWLAGQSTSGLAAAPAAAGASGEDLAERFQAAEQLVAANKIGEAIEIFSAKIQSVSSLREKLMWEVGLCRLLNIARKTRLAGPFIKEILELIESHRLERWEPDLALEALTVVWTGLRQLDDKKDAQLLEAVFDRITALKPSRALDLI